MVSDIENTVNLLHVHSALASGKGQSPGCLDHRAMQSFVHVGLLVPWDTA